MIQMMFLTVDYKLYYMSKPLSQEYCNLQEIPPENDHDWF